MATGTQEASPPGELARVSETEEGRSGRERWVKRNIPTAHSRNAPLPPPPTAAVPLPRGGRFGRSLGAAPQRRLPGVLSSSFYRSIYPVRGICFYFCGIRWHSVASGGIRWHSVASTGYRRMPPVSGGSSSPTGQGQKKAEARKPLLLGSIFLCLGLADVAVPHEQGYGAAADDVAQGDGQHVAQEVVPPGQRLKGCALGIELLAEQA